MCESSAYLAVEDGEKRIMKLVVMDIETYARRESMLKLRENLVTAEESRLSGRTGHSIDEEDV